jgi:hypothetical protein
MLIVNDDTEPFCQFGRTFATTMPQLVSKREMETDDDSVSGARLECNRVGALGERCASPGSRLTRRTQQASDFENGPVLPMRCGLSAPVIGDG